MSKNVAITIVCISLVAVIGLGIWVKGTTSGIEFINNYKSELQKSDDNTDYETKKKVEDTCRAMITSYEQDLLMWETYRDSEKESEQEWAQEAKIRANKTATSYNNYILKNNYVWSNNVPADICNQLEYIE